MYGSSDGGYRPPATQPPTRSSGMQSALWMLSALIVVVAAGVTIAVVLVGGTNSPDSQRSSVPTGSRTTSPTSRSTSSTPSPTGGAPTTDVLPDNAQSGSCGVDVTPNLVAVGVVTVLSLVQNNTPDETTTALLKDCTSAAVRSRISQLYGLRFGIDYSADLTGGSDKGPTARYTVGNEAGTATLTLTLTRQEDGHYEVTDFSYG